MTEAAIKAVAMRVTGLSMIFCAMYGLHVGIEYSGWLLFVGILVAAA